MQSIDIYWVFIPPFAKSDQLSPVFSVMDSEERAAFYRYRVDFKRVEFLTGRVLLKGILAKRLRVAANTIRFYKTSFGKLHLSCGEVTQLHFNLSHSGNLVVAVFSIFSEVGIDVEDIRPDFLALMVDVLTQDEVNYVLGDSLTNSRHKRFFELWTRKEALLKYRGVGLSVSPQSIAVPFGDAVSRIDGVQYWSSRILKWYFVSVVSHVRNESISYRVHPIDFMSLVRFVETQL